MRIMLALNLGLGSSKHVVYYFLTYNQCVILEYRNTTNSELQTNLSYFTKPCSYLQQTGGGKGFSYP